MTDFLLELRSEEIPARMQARARDDLARLFTERLSALGVTHGAVITYATPRRLALIVRDLPGQTAASTEERKGPRADAPEQAIAGFLRSTGLTRAQLVERTDAKGGTTLFAVIHRPGIPTPSVLASAVSHVIHAFPWPKAMRWGAASTSTESLRWVRPLHGIVALFGDAIVPVEVAGIRSGAATVGHRFHHPGPITIGSAVDYAETLRAARVIVDPAERADLIGIGAARLAADAGLTLVRDEGLLAENAGLTEWPVPLLGRFDAEFLSVPPEVIQLTARVNQKYFVCTDAAGKLAGSHRSNTSMGALANAFVCVANVAAADGGAKIVEGNRKVLAARLADARFFYDTDLKTRLEDLTPKLAKIVFHEKLGTVADKVDRVAKLARWLVEEGIVGASRAPAQAGAQGNGAQPSPGLLPAQEHDRARLADQAERAARLAKADLVTGMVGEFPELQGIIGGYYAAAQGEDPQVAAAIRDHYKPVGQGDEVPTAPVTVAVSLADKLDTFVSFFAIGEKPTGSKDPFALRRAAVGIVRLMVENGLRRSFSDVVREARANFILSLGRSGHIVSFNDEVSYSQIVAAQPAEAEKTTYGHIYVVPFDVEPQSFEEHRGFAYPAYSRDYLDGIRPAIKQVYSLIDLVGDTVLYFGDRIAEAEKASGVRIDLVRSVIPHEKLIVDIVATVTGESPRQRGLGIMSFRRRNWGASDDPVDILARVRALQAFVGTDDGANLLAGYKRAANILKKEGYASPPPVTPAEAGVHSSDAVDGAASHAPMDSRLRGNDGVGDVTATQKPLSYTPEPAEEALIVALDAAEPAAAAAVADEDFERAMTALATLRAPIDAFFDSVTVNDPDPDRRTARLALLARVRAAVHAVADFSRIEG